MAALLTRAMPVHAATPKAGQGVVHSQLSQQVKLRMIGKADVSAMTICKTNLRFP